MLPKYLSILKVYDEKQNGKGPMTTQHMSTKFNQWQKAHHDDNASPFILHSICSTFKVWPSYIVELERCCWPDAASFGQEEDRVWTDEVTFAPSASQAACSFAGMCPRVSAVQQHAASLYCMKHQCFCRYIHCARLD